MFQSTLFPTMYTAPFLVLTSILALIKCEYIPPGPKYRCPKEHLLLHPCKCDTESDVGVTVRCENTNLASMSVGLSNLATFRLPIEKLTISNCHICQYNFQLIMSYMYISIYSLLHKLIHYREQGYSIQVIERITYYFCFIKLSSKT